MNTPKVAIVMLNYNGYEDTHECIQSIESVFYNNYDVIVVDNASTRDDAGRLRVNFPNVTVIESSKNLGFTGGNNVGLLKAYEIGADYIFCLNNDTVVSENILEELVGFMEENQDVGLVGPLMCYYDSKTTVSSAGGTVERNTGLISFFHRGDTVNDIVDGTIFCEFIEGSALFIRASLMKRIGGFNDFYFLTSEESELCVRVADLGYRLAVISSCRVWHKVSQTMVTMSELSSYYIFRNKLFFVKFNHSTFVFKNFLHILKYYCICFSSFLLVKREYFACWGMVKGVIDFCLGRGGSGRFKN